MKWTIKGKYETAEKLPFSFLVSDENRAVVAEKTLLEMSQDRKDLDFCDYIQCFTWLSIDSFAQCEHRSHKICL